MGVTVGMTMDSNMGYVVMTSVTNNVFTSRGNHGFRAGDFVSFAGPSGDLVPNGYVIADGLTDNTFKISLTRGGSAYAVTGIGGHSLQALASTLERHITTTLAADMTSNTTSMTVANGSTFPAVPFMAVIVGRKTSEGRQYFERVKVTAVSGTNNTSWTVVRGQEGTVAGAHSSGIRVYLRSLATVATAFSVFDSFEASMRPNSPSSDARSDAGNFNTLKDVTSSTASGYALNVASHGMSAGDRFVFMSKTGGSNLRLGQTYYVLASGLASNYFSFAEESFGTASAYFGTDISSGQIRRFTIGGTRKLNATNTRYPRVFGWNTSFVAASTAGPMNIEANALSLIHFRGVEDRGAQNMIHLTTHGTQDWEVSGKVNADGVIKFPYIYDDGGYNSRIDALGEQIGLASRKFVIRLNYEMDGKGMLWGAENKNAKSVGNNSAKWISAWKHIRTRIRNAAGASNVGFFWCLESAEIKKDTARRFYPKGAVDYAGVDFYTWGHEIQSRLLPSYGSDYSKAALRNKIRTNNGTNVIKNNDGNQSGLVAGDLMQFLSDPGGSGANRPLADGSVYKIVGAPENISKTEARYSLVKIQDGNGNKVNNTPVTWTGTLNANVTIRTAPRAKGEVMAVLKKVREITQFDSNNPPIMIGEMGYYGYP